MQFIPWKLSLSVSLLHAIVFVTIAQLGSQPLDYGTQSVVPIQLVESKSIAPVNRIVSLPIAERALTNSHGESVAAHVGIEISRVRMEIIFWVALLSGFAVAWCGMIGFIGLIAPNFARAWLGGDQRVVVPASMLLGGILLLLADTCARTIAIPAEVPVGIFTALLGAPFFILLLRSSRRQLT
jgi:ABC-type Fe3+-siderophore transport system permease subunit